MITYRFNNQVKGMYNELAQNDKVEITHAKTAPSASKKEVNLIVDLVKDEANRDFHREMDGFEFQWKMKNREGNRFGGTTKILSLEAIMGDWRNIVYFDFDPMDCQKRQFKIIDFFVDEACVGFFIDKQPGLFYHEFESEFYPLYLDFDGYFNMLMKSCAFWYWPKVIIELNQKSKGQTTKHFITCMTELFPGFSFESYTDEYEKNKLR